MTRRPLLATKWRICGLLFLATTLNYLDRQTLSILAPLLREDMHLDNERLGWLFAVFYAYTLSHFGGPKVVALQGKCREMQERLERDTQNSEKVGFK